MQVNEVKAIGTSVKVPYSDIPEYLDKLGVEYKQADGVLYVYGKHTDVLNEADVMVYNVYSGAYDFMSLIEFNYEYVVIGAKPATKRDEDELPQLTWGE